MINETSIGKFLPVPVKGRALATGAMLRLARNCFLRPVATTPLFLDAKLNTVKSLCSYNLSAREHAQLVNAVDIVRSLYFLPMQATYMAFAKLNKMLNSWGMSDAKTRMRLDNIINSIKTPRLDDLIMPNGGEPDLRLVAQEMACCGRTDEQKKYYFERAIEICGGDKDALVKIAENLSLWDSDPARALKVYDLVLNDVDRSRVQLMTSAIESLCRAGRKRGDKLLFLNKAIELLGSTKAGLLLLATVARALLLSGEVDRARPLVATARETLNLMDQDIMSGAEDGIDVLSQAEAMLFVNDNLGTLPEKDLIERAFKKLDSVNYGKKIAVHSTMNETSCLFLVEEVKEVASAWLTAYLMGCGLKKESIVPKIVELIKRNIESRERKSLKEEGRYLPTIEILRILKDAGVSREYVNQEMMRLILFMQGRCTIEDEAIENAFALRGMRIVTEAAFDLMEYEFNDIDQALVAFLKQEVPGFAPEAYSEISIADAPLLYCLRFLKKGTRMKVLQHHEKSGLLVALSSLGVNDASSKIPNLISAMVDDLISTRDRSGRFDYSELNGFMEVLNKSNTPLSEDPKNPQESIDLSRQFTGTEAFMTKVRDLVRSTYPSANFFSAGVVNDFFFKFACDKECLDNSGKVGIYLRMIENGVIPDENFFGAAIEQPEKFMGFISRVGTALKSFPRPLVPSEFSENEFFADFVGERRFMREDQASAYVDILNSGFIPDKMVFPAVMNDRQNVPQVIANLSRFGDVQNETFYRCFALDDLLLKGIFANNFATLFKVENSADFNALFETGEDYFQLQKFIVGLSSDDVRTVDTLRSKLLDTLRDSVKGLAAGLNDFTLAKEMRGRNEEIIHALKSVSLPLLKDSGVLDILMPLIRDKLPNLPQEIESYSEAGLIKAQINLLTQYLSIKEDPNVDHIFDILKRYGSIEQYYRVKKQDALQSLEKAGFNVAHLLSRAELVSRSKVSGAVNGKDSPFEKRLQYLVKGLLGERGSKPTEIFSFNSTPSDRGRIFSQINKDNDYRNAVSGNFEAAKKVIRVFLKIVSEARGKEKDDERKRKLEEYHDLFSGLVGELEGGRKVVAGAIRCARSRKLVPEILFDNERLSCCIFKPNGAVKDEISRIVLDPRTPLIEVWLEGMDEFMGVVTEYLGKNKSGQPVILMDSFESNSVIFSRLGRNFSLKAVLDSLIYDAFLMGGKEVVIHKINYGKPLEFVNFVKGLAGDSEYKGVIRFNENYYFEAVDAEDAALSDSKTGRHHYTDAFKEGPMKGEVKSILIDVGAYAEKFFKDGKPA